MNNSDHIEDRYTSKKAVIYIRQSTPNQALSNQESLKLQYALKKRALDLGWLEENIEIIDSDIGITGSSTANRNGFKDLVTKVSLGQVGIILSYEVTRLSRNCTDWYQLLDICGLRECLIGDRDGNYDPSSHNGRLILGLKGQISELELHTLKGRLTAGLINKAKRGELALRLPVGLVRDINGIVRKDPDIEIQHRLELIFETFLKVKSASKTLKYLLENNLPVPRRDNFGDLQWKKPTNSSVIRILKNPAYAGMFVYGRSRYYAKGLSSQNNSRKQLPIEDWKIKVEDKYPAYISRETYEKILQMLKDNYSEYDREETRGVPRTGKAMLHGIVYCGECGHKMVVQYKRSTRYMCNHLRRQYGAKVCQYIPADPVDDHVVTSFFEAISPIELNMFEAAVEAKQSTENKTMKAKVQQLERLRYQAKLAERQYNQTDPDNRLVASELEKRWETALKELKKVESDFERQQQQDSIPLLISQKMKKDFTNIADSLPNLWNQGTLSQQQKKALLRCLIDKVVIRRSVRDKIDTRIVWKGGETSTIEIPVKVGSIADLSNTKLMEQEIITMAKDGKSDNQIAHELTSKGFRSPLRSVVLPSTVQTIRLRNRIKFKRGKNMTYPTFLP